MQIPRKIFLSDHSSKKARTRRQPDSRQPISQSSNENRMHAKYVIYISLQKSSEAPDYNLRLNPTTFYGIKSLKSSKMQVAPTLESSDVEKAEATNEKSSCCIQNRFLVSPYLLLDRHQNAFLCLGCPSLEKILYHPKKKILIFAVLWFTRFRESRCGKVFFLFLTKFTRAYTYNGW